MFVAAVILTTAVAAALAVALAVLPAARRGPGPATGGDPNRELDLYDVAFLGEGPTRVVNVALLRMHESGALHISSTGEVTLSGAGSDTDAVQTAIRKYVRSHAGPTHVGELRDHVKRTPAVQGIGDRLADDGLLLRNDLRPREIAGTASGIMFLLAVPTAIVAILAFPSPINWAIAVGSGLAFLVPFLGAVLERLSPAGHARLKRVRRDDLWAGSPENMLLGAVALGGLVAIESELLREAMSHEQAHASATSAAPATWCSTDAVQSSGGGSDGGGGGGGCGSGSGCGGGGCGGCGG